MVRLAVTTLLAIALAAGPALAFSHEYERRSDLDSNLYERGLVDDQEMLVSRQDLEDLYGRLDIDDLKQNFRTLKHKAKSLVSRREFFDDLEAREPQFGLALLAGRKALKYAPKVGAGLKSLFHRISPHRRADSSSNSRREFVDDLEAREPQFGVALLAGRKALKVGANAVEHHHHAVGLGAEVGVSAYAHRSHGHSEHATRELHEELFVRDLDAEELFGREYDLLDERDIDDLD